MKQFNGRTFTPAYLRHIILSIITFGLAVTTVHAAESAEGEGPWRLSNALSLPEWLELSGSHRVRYETLDGQFRAGGSGSDQILVFRTTLKAEVTLDSFQMVGEILDARQALADSGTPLGTDDVNTFNLLQAYVGWDSADSFEENQFDLKLGRQTLDLGSLRLVGRNRYRNTINAFTGIYGNWERENGFSLSSFFFVPVHRLPGDFESLKDNEFEFDEENFDVQFWGLFGKKTGLPLGGTGEAYLFGLHESDSSSRPTSNRDLLTPGLRFYRSPARSHWDFDFESVLQFGESRSSAAATDTTDLDHFAQMFHAEVGYTFDVAGSPRLAVTYNYASGDDDPSDDENNRFDTLFGLPPIDFGPVGIYGAFTRSNINAPGYLVSVNPRQDLMLLFTHRFYWLASDTDAWVTSGVRDPSGQSGSFIGNELEGHVRWDILPGNLRLQAGAAYLFAGEFAEDAPNATGEGDTTYGYLQLELTF